jgi:transcription initiation factor TFIID subunit 6
VAVKPLVKHILSKELQLYFEKICGALLDEANDEYRIAALASLRSDPGLHQLVPYFVQFVAEKVTHNMKSLFVLNQMMQLTSAMLDNESLYVDPYVASVVPPILTCVIAPHLGSSSNRLEHYPLRTLAASLLGLIAKKFSKSSHQLKPRLARTFLKHFLNPNEPFAIHFGAILGIHAVGGRESVRVLILPNLREYCDLLQSAFESGGSAKEDAEMVIGAVLGVLAELEEEGTPLVNGFASRNVEEQKAKLGEKIGPLLAARAVKEGRPKLVQAIMQADIVRI